MTEKNYTFDSRATEWDTPARLENARIITDAIIRHVHLKPLMQILDYGAGTGLISFGLISRVAGITAADSSTGMISVLKEKIKNSGQSGIEAILVNDATMPQNMGPFDLIIISMTLHHVDDINKMIHNCSRELTTGGTIVIVDLAWDAKGFHSETEKVSHHGFKKSELTELFEKNGLNPDKYTIIRRVIKSTPQNSEAEFGMFLYSAIKIDHQ